MTDEWLSLSDAAEMLGVHPSTVRLWSDKGVLPVHKTQGGHRRYRRSEISLWAQTNSKSRLEALQPESMMQEVIRNVRMQISEGVWKLSPGIKNWMQMRVHNTAWGRARCSTV
jgi:excisionase family DNA binding protein